MKGKSLSKKAIITIVIIAILLIVAISMVVVFLKDQGKTEATAISENNSNSSQTEQAVQEENRREETNQPANEENAEAEVEQTEEITDNSQNVQTNVGTQQAQTTTTADADSQTTTIDTTVTVPTEEVNLGWSNVTVSGGELLANIDANVTDVTAPIRLATNILKNGESNDLKEYYVKRKDEILMYIAVNEELVHNPTFTLINDGKEYIMEDSLVTVRQDNETRWVYTVIYKIPENTTFVDGEITLKISNIEDKAGNKLPDENGPTNGHRVFYDGTLPEIHVKGTEGYIEEKENYVGNSEKNIYSKVSFKLKDNYKVVEYEVNDTLIKITPNSWTDANYANIKTYLVEGENTIIVRDIAGNEATYKFTYDSIAPVYSKLGILNKTRYVNNVKDLTWAKEGDEVRILISFPEKLAIEPKVKIFGKEYTATYRPLSSSPEKNSYYYMVDFKLDKTMPEGEIPFEISGYADEAKNVGEKLNNANINHDQYTKVVYDLTAPEIIVKEESKGTDPYFSNVSFKLHDNYLVKEYEINGNVVEVTPNAWTDANFQNIKQYLVAGENTIIVRDMAGNVTTRTFIYDTVAPEIIIKEESKGTDPYFSNVSFKLHDNYLVKEYEINGNVVEVTPNAWTDANFQNIKQYLVAGENTIIVRDMAGNATTRTFIYDTVAPEITVKEESKGTDPYFSNVSFKLHDNYLVKEYEINGNVVEVTPNAWTDANFQNIKQYLVAGENTIIVRDMAGNATTRTFIYDTVAPEMTVKEESKGTDPYFSNVSFKLHDNYLVKEYEINENVVEVTPNAWTDANFQNIKQYLVAGENTIIVRDMAGNATTRTFIYDTVAPEITVKEESKGTDPYFSNVSFKLHDNYLVKEYEINGKIMKVTPNAWTDANFQNIKQYLVAGENTIIVRDMAGNATTKTFIYDTVAPEYSAMGIFNWTNNKDGEDVKIATKNEHIRLFVAFPEMLEINPKVDIYGENGVTTTKELEYSEAAKFYFVEFDTTEELKLPQGKISYKVYGYEDIAGNVGKDLTEKDTTDIRYPEVIYDSVAPKYIKLGIARNKNTTDLREQEYAKVGDSVRVLISFPESLAVEPKVKMFDKEYDVTYRPDSSNVNANIYYYMADIEITEDMPEGEITFEIYGYEDMAGNVGERLANQNINNELYTKVIIDNTAPKATVTFSNKNGAELTNQDVLATLTADEAIQNIEGWTRIDDRTFTKIYSVNGKYSVEIADLTGNTSVIRYEVKRIDKTAPEATVTFSNDNGATMTNQDVTVTLKANETIRDIEGWTRVNDRTFTKVYSENGKYSVEIIDKVGNTSTIKFEVKRIDKTAPVITLPTKNTFEVGVDIYTYPEAGSVYDESDKEISFSKVNIAWFKATANGEKGERVDSFEWNTSLKNRDLGTYYIEYWVADKAGNVGRAHRLLTLQDTTKPTIILNGENKQEIELGTGTYLEQGATVTDNRDEKVENIEPYKIDWYSQNGLQEFNVSKVDINKAGQYNVFYQYTDKAGNYSQIIRKVFVIDSNELELSEPKYTTLDNGNILVTIKANKLIKNIDGWKLSEDGKEISKEYTKNTDYLGEEIVISDIYGKTKKLTVKISDIKENGKAIVYVGSSDTLRTLAKDINNGKEFKNTIIKLTKNINLSGKEWTPIYSTKGVLQNATIDGNNFTITGMVTSRNPYIANGSLEKPYGNGFISDNTCTLTIKNIKFNNVTINDPTGGTGTNYSQHYQGTVVGHNQGQLKLENIKVTNADINGSWQCGGLVGFSATDLVFNSCTISDSYIGGPNATAGTIFGLGIINATMNNCKAENIKLYTDSLTFDTNAKRGEGFWVGSLYPSNGTKLTVNNSVETNVTVVDKK